MTKKKTRTKESTELLAALRKEHRDQVKAAQLSLKDQQRVRKELRRALQSGPLTVPELATKIELPAHEVLWHIAAMKKYGDVVEEGLQDYEFYLYGLTQEAAS